MKQKNRKIKFGVAGGALTEAISELLKRAGYTFLVDGKFSDATIDDEEIECFFGRANEIAMLIHQGVIDGGIVSKAALAETKAKILTVAEIGTPGSAWKASKVILAVPETSSIKSIQQLEGKRIITRLPSIAKDFLRANKIKAQVEFSQAKNESRVPALADALIEFVHTGETLDFYDLKPLEVIMENANFLSVVMNPQLKDPGKKEKIAEVALLLKGARLGEDMVGLMLHASNDMMEEVFKILPALKKPTVTHLRGENWFDVFTIAYRSQTRALIPQLKEIGCTDIIEFSLNKVIV